MPDTRVIALARSRPDRSDANVHWIESSLEDLKPSHWHGFETTPFDAVLHLAAFTPKVGAERDMAAPIITANIVGLQHLLASLCVAPRRFVFCSTLDVYSRAAFERVVDEQSAIGPAGGGGFLKMFWGGGGGSYCRGAGAGHGAVRLGP